MIRASCNIPRLLENRCSVENEQRDVELLESLLRAWLRTSRSNGIVLAADCSMIPSALDCPVGDISSRLLTSLGHN